MKIPMKLNEWPTFPESKVYAILVTHTKRGKPRKRLAWAQHSFDGWATWYIDLNVHVLLGNGSDLGMDLFDAERLIKLAESALGCRCAVVEITLEGKVV